MAFDVKMLLTRFVPGINHELIPHGVPSGYDWYGTSSRCKWTGCDDAGCTIEDYKLGNWWGVIYTDITNAHPPNTRVNVWKDVKMLYLYEGTTQWQLIQQSLNNTSSWGGCGYREDFATCDSGLGDRLEPDGTISYVPNNGHNSHFWPGPFINLQTNKKLHCITIMYARLIKANPSGTDDRTQSKYIISAGGDFRKSYDQLGIMRGFAVGKFIQPTNEWRIVIGSSLSLNNLNTLPMPSAEYFIMPDGTYPTCLIPQVSIVIY